MRSGTFDTGIVHLAWCDKIVRSRRVCLYFYLLRRDRLPGEQGSRTPTQRKLVASVQR